MRRVLLVLVMFISAVLAFGCNGPDAKSAPAGPHWVLKDFRVRVIELNESADSRYAPRPTNIEVIATVENQAANPAANAQLLVNLPEDTEFIKGIGAAEENQAEIAPGQAIHVSYTHKGPYTGVFKKDAALSTLEGHIKNSSTVIVKWQENGQLKELILFPSQS